MRIVGGIDIGNSTTEVALGRLGGEGRVEFLAEASVPTTGAKGSPANVEGILRALEEACAGAGISPQDLSSLRLNEAAPVIGDTAMETITETILTDSAMVGHNPDTPAGAGVGVGEIQDLAAVEGLQPGRPYILTVGQRYGYQQVAEAVNALAAVFSIEALILQKDEAVLVWNRLEKKIPIIDEVRGIDRIPQGRLAAVEVAMPGMVIRQLSNPYGIATLLGLDAEQTRAVTPMAKSLIGKRSGVVIKSPSGYVGENPLPAGELYLEGAGGSARVAIDEGADAIMASLSALQPLADAKGEENTNVGNMFGRMRGQLADLGQSCRIRDILAVDTLAPVLVSGALAGETCMERAVGLAAMVETGQLPMGEIARRLESRLGVSAKVGGVEAAMAILGAMTTPGTKLPLAMVDMGGGSTDAALLDIHGELKFTHKAGAGELVSLLIQTELGLASRQEAEMIKRYPLAKIESLYHMRLESGAIRFLSESIDPRLYGCVVMLHPEDMIPIQKDLPMERISQVRREAKEKVFVRNVLRALEEIAPGGRLRAIPNVVLVGGSAEDFEIPEMLTQALSEYRIVCGRGHIRGRCGPRNAVATGLALSLTVSEE